jgi:endonuclease-3 related protein
MTTTATIRKMHAAMLAALGPSHWWPGDSPFEIAVGAVLTQNTNWGNVERAIANLKTADVLNPAAMLALEEGRLAELIRPAGYFNVKARRLRNFLTLLEAEAEAAEADLSATDLAMLVGQAPDELRDKLLAVKGIGPETADSILCYALDLPYFVVDAYTARLAGRHGLTPEDVSYDELQETFADALDPADYNEGHALIVRIGKGWCRPKNPRCATCPLEPFLP